MPNNKYYGYTPKMSSEENRQEGSTEFHNRLDRYNPFEFRKGMDFELATLGCSRLRESTQEEREKATEKVLKNLEEIPNYYTSFITYESLFKNVSGTKPTFKAWMKEQENPKMQEVNRGDTDSKHKDDKMTDKLPKYTKSDYTVPSKVKADALKESKVQKLKETIKKQLKIKLLEQDLDLDMDSDAADKAATKAAKKSSKNKGKGEPKKNANRFDNEIKALENLLFKGDKEDSEHTKNDPAEGTLLHTRTKEWNEHKSKRDKEGLTIKDWEKRLKELNKEIGEKIVEDHIKEWGPVTDENPKAAGNEGATKEMLMGEDFFQTVKNLEKRIEAVKKEKEEDIKKALEETKEFVQYQMERADHIRLLEIVKENGISLREGAMGVKTYYEIAKAAYLEGLSKGLGL